MEIVFKAIFPEGGNHKGTSSCQAVTCGRTTREGKPYCSDHVDQSPYVRKVLNEIARREIEVHTLETGGALRPDAHLVRETFLLLRMKVLTVKALAKKLDLKQDSAHRLISQVVQYGLAREGETQRGERTIAGLIDPTIQIDEK